MSKNSSILLCRTTAVFAFMGFIFALVTQVYLMAILQMFCVAASLPGAFRRLDP